MSTIQLLKNGKSKAERTRHIDLRYFSITDRIKRGELQDIYKPTADMIADIITKALPTKSFKILRDLLLNTSWAFHSPWHSSIYAMPTTILLHPAKSYLQDTHTQDQKTTITYFTPSK
jgi:hypothetical protein